MTRPLSHEALARRQRGATLIIALIVLVAMSLAGIATMRSVDTSALIAGNIAFKESAMNGADQGIQAGQNYLATQSAADQTQLYLDHNVPGVSSTGYWASVDALGRDKDFSNSATWANAAAVNGGLPDASGNTVYYIVERLCSQSGLTCAPNATCNSATNLCLSTPDAAVLSGEGLDMSQPNFFTKPPSIHYRVTARSVGPRNATTIVQTHIRLQ
jgi:Tfp pilus assembly protein PilX